MKHNEQNNQTGRSGIENLPFKLVVDEIKRRIKSYKKVSISNTYSMVRLDELETLLEFTKNV